MGGMRWALVLVIYGVGASVIYLVYGGGGVPPCFGTAPTGQITPECYAAWQLSLANRPVYGRLFDTPWGAVLVFLALVVGTWVVVRRHTRSVGRPASER